MFLRSKRGHFRYQIYRELIYRSPLVDGDGLETGHIGLYILFLKATIRAVHAKYFYFFISYEMERKLVNEIRCFRNV